MTIELDASVERAAQARAERPNVQDVSDLTHILMMVTLRPFRGVPIDPLIPFILAATIDSTLRLVRGTLPVTPVLLAGIQDNLLRVADMLDADGDGDFAGYAVNIRELELCR